MFNLILMKHEIDLLEISITNKQNELQKLEDSYESLLQFKRLVENDFKVFNEAKRGKEEAISQLPYITSKNTVAKNYSDGMNDLLDRKADIISSSIFLKVLDKINRRLNSLTNEIADCESAINKEQSRLDTQKSEYRKEKEKQDKEKNQ